VGMFFNVAHSGAAILIALCRSRSVGIDIEYFSREVDALEIAKNSFSSNEFLALSSISDSDSLRRSFFRCWTRKEAVIKADGRGLSLPLDSFEVPVGDVSRATEVLISESGKQPVGHYFVCDVPYGDDVAAAVAIAAPRGHAHGFFFPLSMVPRKR